MSVTPGWEPKPEKKDCPGFPVMFKVTMAWDYYYLDNWTEFKKFKNSPEGWAELCEELKRMPP